MGLLHVTYEQPVVESASSRSQICSEESASSNKSAVIPFHPILNSHSRRIVETREIESRWATLLQLRQFALTKIYTIVHRFTCI